MVHPYRSGYRQRAPAPRLRSPSVLAHQNQPQGPFCLCRFTPPPVSCGPAGVPSMLARLPARLVYPPPFPVPDLFFCIVGDNGPPDNSAPHAGASFYRNTRRIPCKTVRCHFFLVSRGAYETLE